MIEINPNALYTRDDLAELFAQVGLDWDAFRAHIQPRRITGRGYWGQHIIDAMDAASGTARSERKAKRVRPARKARRGGELIDIALEQARGK